MADKDVPVLQGEEFQNFARKLSRQVWKEEIYCAGYRVKRASRYGTIIIEAFMDNGKPLGNDPEKNDELLQNHRARQNGKLWREWNEAGKQ